MPNSVLKVPEIIMNVTRTIQNYIDMLQKSAEKKRSGLRSVLGYQSSLASDSLALKASHSLYTSGHCTSILLSRPPQRIGPSFIVGPSRAAEGSGGDVEVIPRPPHLEDNECVRARVDFFGMTPGKPVGLTHHSNRARRTAWTFA